jgi:hypothetical protein
LHQSLIQVSNLVLSKLASEWFIFFFRIYEGINSLADLVALERHEPMDNAVYLMEYVAKTQGSEHFKLGSRHLNGYQGCCIGAPCTTLLLLWSFFLHCKGCVRYFRLDVLHVTTSFVFNLIYYSFIFKYCARCDDSPYSTMVRI